MAVIAQGSSEEELVQLVTRRERELGLRLADLVVEWKIQHDRAEAVSIKISAARDERERLQELLRSYASRGVQPTSTAAETVLGPSDAVLAALRGVPDRAIPYRKLLEQMVTAVAQGRIRTSSTSDAKKLMSSTIGNLVRNTRLLRNGDDIVRLNPDYPESAGAL
jgi:hypothetical protein